MKLLRLDLIAFGPFTDTTLDFDGTDPMLHLIYGPNEAGKSSALRALRQVFFGIPTRTSDDFIHPYARLRIGACIEERDGGRLEVIRRKGRRHTLRGPDDAAVVEERRLRRILGGVDEALFTTMFGIDHAGLVAGGKAILEGAGDAGEILFAAGAGIADFRRVLLDLNAEAEALFKPAAQKPAINAGLSQLQQLRKAQRDAQLPGQDWLTHDSALREALDRKASLEAELVKETRRRNRLMRIRDALPAMARRTELTQRHAPLKTAVLLPDDFSERHLSAVEALRIAESRAARSRQRINAIQKELEGLPVPTAILDSGDAVADLFQEAGSIQKAASDRLRLEGLLSSARREARERLNRLGRDIPLEEAHHLRVAKPAIIRIQELTGRCERLQARMAGIDEEMEKLARRTDRLKEALAALPPPVELAGLKADLAEAASFGDLESRHRALCMEIAKMTAELDIAVTGMPLWEGTPEALERLPLPSQETVEAFDTRIKAVENRMTRQRETAEALADRLGDIDAELRRMTLSGDIPTEADLTTARASRDGTWQEIRAAWEAGDPLTDAPAADRYESQVREADDLADRLRREAERVAAKASLLAEQERLTARQQEASATIDALASEDAGIRGEWARLWRAASITPLSPREMQGWLRRHRALADQAAGIRAKRSEADALLRQIDHCRKALARHLPGTDLERATLSRLVARASAVISEAERLESRRTQISADLAQRSEELQEAGARQARTTEALQQWRREWEAAVRPLGLDADATPAQANGILEELNALFDTLKEADTLEGRIRGIARDEAAFAEKVRELVALQAPDLAGLSPVPAVRELNARLAGARSVNATREGLERQLAQERNAEKEASERIQQIQAQLEALCREAGCSAVDELQAAVARSAERRQVEDELARIEAQLRSLSAGRPLEVFMAESASIDPDTIELQIERIDEMLDQRHREKSDLDQAIGSHRTELATMDGGQRAADIAEERQVLIAGIRADAERYLRLKTAALLLNRAMERYREKNQGPILARATQLFSRMTLGSFEGLRLDFNDRNDAVLVGVRPGGREVVHVSGMSDGTADQLYLAIRLASLEAYLRNSEPLPFVVDDILVHFDDMRAEATLEALAELARKTQVIFFTHHRHLVDLARSCLDGAIAIHTLPTRNIGGESG